MKLGTLGVPAASCRRNNVAWRRGKILDGNAEAETRIAAAARDGATFLDLSGLNINTLPESIGRLTALKSLNLSRNELATLPVCIGDLKALRGLDLRINRLTELPEWLGKLSSLQRLDLSDNQVTTLPEWTGNLTALRGLDLHDNRLTALPEGLDKLTALQTLDVSNNQLTALPEWIGKLMALQTLYFSSNQLTALPEGIGKLTALQTLYVFNNQLTALPEGIGKLTALQALSVSNNQLTALPEWIGKLTALQMLYVFNNQLTTLPEGIGKLTALQTLDVSNNQLTALPEEISRLEKLTELFLQENPQLGLPAEMLGQSRRETLRERGNNAAPRDTLDYYFRSRQGRALNEAKLILVGRGGVGKTSLVKRLVNNQFEAGEKKTEGIQITQWPLKLFEKEDVRLNVWDFGGQEIMHATHQFFLTQRSVYLLVLSGREGTEDMDADYWMRLIESFGGNSPVIVVLNRSNEHRFDVNRRALQQKFPQIREFVVTDCADGTGIGDLGIAIQRETDRLEDLRAKFPASWVSIKDQLAGMSENYLDFESYRKKCGELGERDPDAQKKLAGYLHSLGIALNFSDDPRLRETHVLNPHWVTNGIYKILNAKKLADRKGEVELNGLAALLDQNTYPVRMHNFLLDLMRKFELCFPVGDSASGRYLIPELLDKQEPEETKEFNFHNCLNFQYHYPVLPEGLIPRFIVRTYSMSEGLVRWRSGVILKFEGNHALVNGDAQDRKVSVSVSGPAPGRRNLLAIIRADLERIHADIAKLQPKAMVPIPEHPSVIVEYQKLLTLEQKGVAQIQEVVGDDVLDLDVQTLLNGVDIVHRGRRESARDRQPEGVRVFISYSHKDEELRAQLDANLKLYQRIGLIDKWDDRLIKPGDEWNGEIDANLETADIILLLVSSDFLNSDFCWNKEMTRALERHDAGEAMVIPVIIRDAAWQEAKFAKIQALPKEGKAVTLWPDRDAAWRNVAEGIKKVAEEIRDKGRL
jgi:internalin A